MKRKHKHTRQHENDISPVEDFILRSAYERIGNYVDKNENLPLDSQQIANIDAEFDKSTIELLDKLSSNIVQNEEQIVSLCAYITWLKATEWVISLPD